MALIRWSSFEKREVARDVVTGLTHKEIANRHGRTLRAVKEKLAKDEELQGYIEKLQLALDVRMEEEVGEMLAAARAKVLERLADAAPMAVKTLVELAIEGESESTRFKAAKAIVDRLGLSLVVKRIHHEVESYPTITEENATKLRQVLKAAAESQMHRGELNPSGHDEKLVLGQDQARISTE